MSRVSRWIPSLLLIGATLAVGLVFASHVALADGGIFPPYGHWGDVEMPGQKAILLYDEETGREDLILSVQLLGDVSEAAWVVPLPSAPEVQPASPEWFVQLSELTKPEIVIKEVKGVGAGGDFGNTQQGVEVISREQVGVYDISILESTDPNALLDWLDDNGYAFPPEGQSILDAYVQQGWAFAAMRVHPDEAANLDVEIHPIWFSFKSDQFVYPMRLTSLVDDRMPILLYILADHRMGAATSQFELDFAGELQLEPVEDEGDDLTHLLTDQPYYVSKLRRWDLIADHIEDDLYLHRAVTNEPYRRVVTRLVYEPEPMAPDLPCFPGLLPLGLMVGLGLVARHRFYATDAR